MEVALYKITEKTFLQEVVVKMVIEAPEIAKKRRAGQFVILMTEDKGERIPLTIVDSDNEKGTITIIFQVVGKTTADMAKLNAGDYINMSWGPSGIQPRSRTSVRWSVSGGAWESASFIRLPRP